jgi:hypothetical protein
MRLLIVALVVAGCGKSGPKEKTVDDLRTEYKPRIEARLEKLVAADRAGKAAIASGLGQPGDSKLALDFEYQADTHKPNAIVAHTEDLEDAKKPAQSAKPEDRGPLTGPKLIFAENDRNHVLLGKSLIGIEKGGFQHEYMTRQLVDAQYVLVVYPTSFKPAMAIGSSFTPGTATGTAVLVEIESGKPLGGFEFTAQSSDEIHVSVSKRSGTSNADDKVRDDLYSQTGKAIANAIKVRWPGAKVPTNWGYGW